MSTHEKGKKRIQEILGTNADEIIKSLELVSPDFAKYAVDFAYGDIYARPNFADKHRELAAVACLIGQGNNGVPLKAHLKGMLNVGWKKEEVNELLIFLVGFIGFPSIVDALGIFKQVLDENAV